MIILIAAEEAFDKIQHPFMIKTLQKVGIEGTYLNKIKVIYDKPTANIIHSGEKLKAFSLKLDKDAHSHHFYSAQFWKAQPWQSRRNETQIGKEEIKLSLFAYDMILYIENPTDTARKLLELISKFSKVQDTKLRCRYRWLFYTIEINVVSRTLKFSVTISVHKLMIHKLLNYTSAFNFMLKCF